MELLLNLLWVLLIPPAFYCWFQQRFRSRSALRFVALAGALAFLFPVISATDDLHSVAELCESAPSKRTLRYFTGESSARQQGDGGASATAPTFDIAQYFALERIGFVILYGGITLQQDSVRIPSGRAPPTFF
jgi:hypothetical protein